MGLIWPSKNDRAEAERYDAKAAKYAEEAREEARKAKRYREAKSSDPAADRYMAEEHDSNRRIAAANAKGHRETAKQLRKWF